MMCKMKFPDFSKDVLRKFVEDSYITTDHDLMCFLYCLGHEMSYMDEGGNFELNNMIMHRPPLMTENQIRGKVDTCDDDSVVADDGCEMAYKRIHCFFTGNVLRDE